MKTLEDYYRQTEIESEEDNDEALKLFESFIFGGGELTLGEEEMCRHLGDIIEAFEAIHYPMGDE